MSTRPAGIVLATPAPNVSDAEFLSLKGLLAEVFHGGRGFHGGR